MPYLNFDWSKVISEDALIRSDRINLETIVNLVPSMAPQTMEAESFYGGIFTPNITSFMKSLSLDVFAGRNFGNRHVFTGYGDNIRIWGESSDKENFEDATDEISRAAALGKSMLLEGILTQIGYNGSSIPEFKVEGVYMEDSGTLKKIPLVYAPKIKGAIKFLNNVSKHLDTTLVIPGKISDWLKEKYVDSIEGLVDDKCVLTRINVASQPSLTHSPARFIGVSGLMYVGVLAGYDLPQKMTIGFYTDTGIHVVGRSYSDDETMDTLAYLTRVYDISKKIGKNIPILVGGRFMPGKNHRKFVIEYVNIEGPYDTSEHRILTHENFQSMISPDIAASQRHYPRIFTHLKR